jgi:SAM-dependent methyltransferase
MKAQEYQEITEAVRSRYSGLALKVLHNQESEGCCDSLSCNPVSSGLYSSEELATLPERVATASLGCGNPTALARLNPGEVVLDLGSGGGLDVLLSARRVGPTGFAYGVDMTDEMLQLARTNAREAGIENVAFLKGDIAAVPLPDNSVDVIISNCVINLAADKGPVLKEAYRLLKPGGRLAVSDIVIHGGLPSQLTDTPAQRRELSEWAGAIAGALTDAEYQATLAALGFSDIQLEVTRRYSLEDLGDPKPAWVTRVGASLAMEIVGRFASTFVRATKPL